VTIWRRTGRKAETYADAAATDAGRSFATAVEPDEAEMSGRAPGLADEVAPEHRGFRRRPDPWRKAFFGVLAVALLAIAVWAVLGSSLLVVRHVQVTGNHLVPAGEIRALAEIKPGTPMARVDAGAAARRVEQIRPVLSATVSRSWPDTIVITVTERTPVLAVALAVGGYGLVDAHGVVVRTAAHPPAGMPLLTSPPAVLRGSPGIMAAAMVLRSLPHALRKLVRSVSAVSASPVSASAVSASAGSASAGSASSVSASAVSASAVSASTVTLHLAHGITVVWGGTGQVTQKTEVLDSLLRTRARYYDVSDPQTAVTRG
jgi:cell division protein FtsQ